MTESDVSLDCNYAYEISASISKDILSFGDGSSFRLKITDSSNAVTFYSLSQLLDGVVYYGTINDLMYNIDKTIKIEVFVINTNSVQNNLSGNNITVTITPRSGKSGFNCDLPVNYETEAKGKEFAQFLVDNSNRIAFLWNSGLKDDGYRYIGTNRYYCSYDNYTGLRTSDTSCSQSIPVVGHVGSDGSNQLYLDSDGQSISSFSPNNYIMLMA